MNSAFRSSDSLSRRAAAHLRAACSRAVPVSAPRSEFVCRPPSSPVRRYPDRRSRTICGRSASKSLPQLTPPRPPSCSRQSLRAGASRSWTPVSSAMSTRSGSDSPTPASPPRRSPGRSPRNPRPAPRCCAPSSGPWPPSVPGAPSHPPAPRPSPRSAPCPAGWPWPWTRRAPPYSAPSSVRSRPRSPPGPRSGVPPRPPCPPSTTRPYGCAARSRPTTASSPRSSSARTPATSPAGAPAGASPRTRSPRPR